MHNTTSDPNKNASVILVVKSEPKNVTIDKKNDSLV